MSPELIAILAVRGAIGGLVGLLEGLREAIGARPAT